MSAAPILARRRWLLGGAGLAAAAAGAGLWAWRSGGLAPADPAVQTLWTLRFERPEGGELVMSQLHGKPLLINFWATWCKPCVREMPEIDRFHREQAAAFGWQVLGLAIDGPSPVRDYLQRVKVGFPIGLAGLDGSELVIALGNASGGLPFTVLIDANGRITRRKLGETHHDELLTWARST